MSVSPTALTCAVALATYARQCISRGDTPEQAGYAELIEMALRKERQACAALVCVFCAGLSDQLRREPERDGLGAYRHHGDTPEDAADCLASAIWERNDMVANGQESTQTESRSPEGSVPRQPASLHPPTKRERDRILLEGSPADQIWFSCARVGCRSRVLNVCERGVRYNEFLRRWFCSRDCSELAMQ